MTTSRDAGAVDGGRVFRYTAGMEDGARGDRSGEEASPMRIWPAVLLALALVVFAVLIGDRSRREPAKPRPRAAPATPEPTPKAAPKADPTAPHYKILAVRSSHGLVMISGGADDGLRGGDRLNVYRGNTLDESSYITAIVIDKLFPDMSSAKIVPGGMNVAEGDWVQKVPSGE